MIKSGTRPAKHIYKEKKFHKHFGSVSTANIPDFNLDAGLTMPDQNADGGGYECVGYTIADILTDYFKVPFSPDFSYAAARYIAGDGPEGTPGTSFHAGIHGAVAFGGLLASQADFTAKEKGEQFVSDWNNWSDEDRKSAIQYIQNGIYNVLGNGDAFDSILSALWVNKVGISVGTAWYEEWYQMVPSGITATPKMPHVTNNLSWHNYSIKGKKTIGGIPYLIIKPWQGTARGDGGYMYFSRETINTVLSVHGSGAVTISKNAIRWVSLIGILLQRFPALLPYLPMLLKSLK